MSRLKTHLFILGSMVLTSCSTMPVAELAPESVAGRIIRLDDRRAQICECPMGSANWSAWQSFRYGSVIDASFDTNNQYRRTQPVGETSCMTYRKTGANTGEIRFESAEMAHTCYLNFDTPISGTATKEGYGADNDYKQRNIQFQIK